MAGEGGHRGDACERLLGSRAGAPGLSRALPERVHLPLPAARLETAEARRSLGSRLATAHSDEAAVLGREGDVPEVDLLVWGVVRLDHELPQYRSQHDIQF